MQLPFPTPNYLMAGEDNTVVLQTAIIPRLQLSLFPSFDHPDNLNVFFRKYSRKLKNTTAMIESQVSMRVIITCVVG